MQRGGIMTSEDYKLHPLGDCAVSIELERRTDAATHRKLQRLLACLEQELRPFPGFIEAVPAYHTIAVYYDPMTVFSALGGREGFDPELRSPHEIVCMCLNRLFASTADAQRPHSITVEIPVCYGGQFGPDLEEVARYNALSPEEVIRIHTGGSYPVYFIGFAPGFPYLGGMDERISTPRKSTPRLCIPAGSVGIAGKQTGVYSLETPGGWQLIGRTPLCLFRPWQNPPSLLKPGDIVHFRPIAEEQFPRLQAKELEQRQELAQEEAKTLGQGQEERKQVQALGQQQGQGGEHP